MAFDIDTALRTLVYGRGSDLHLKVGAEPRIRVNGELRAIDGAPVLTREDTAGAVQHMLDDQVKLSEFAVEREVDFSYEITDLARFRVNAFHVRGTVSLVVRAIP